MYTVTKEIRWCNAHRLPSHQGLCKNIHGHNYKADIAIHATGLNESGMVLDFGEIKKQMQVWVDENWDHGLMMQTGDVDGILDEVKKMGFKLILIDDEPTAETMARLLHDKATELCGVGITVTVWETPTSCATHTK